MHCTKERGVVTLLVVAAAGLAVSGLSGCGGLSPGGSGEDAINQGVYPPNAVIFGKTYSEWADEWCKWFLAIPKSVNPAMDDTGIHAGVNQSGPVWFLAGTVGTTAERRCTVPAGKAILFPIICGFFWVPTDAATPEELPGLAQFVLDHATEVEAIVDGVPLRGLENYRFRSQRTFWFTGPTAPDECIYPNQDGPHETFADGYYVMLEPPPRGPHELYFRGKLVFPGTYPDVQVIEITIAYHLTVQ